MPQQKKDPSIRARSNKASTASTLSTGGHVIAPVLPDLVDDEGMPRQWRPATLEWWADLWASPMASEYHASDRHALFILASLVDQFWTSPDSKLAAEIRLQRQAFGLTPYDRRRLEWTIETAEESKDRGTARRQRQGASQPRAGSDPRSALHAV